MEQNDIAALLESLCEHPLTDGRVEPSPELAALCREAAKAFSRAGAAGSDGGDIADAGPLTAALAALLSSADAQAARRLADAMLRSAAARLDAQSALAFVAAIEQSPQSPPRAWSMKCSPPTLRYGCGRLLRESVRELQISGRSSQAARRLLGAGAWQGPARCC